MDRMDYPRGSSATPSSTDWRRDSPRHQRGVGCHERVPVYGVLLMAVAGTSVAGLALREPLRGNVARGN